MDGGHEWRRWKRRRMKNGTTKGRHETMKRKRDEDKKEEEEEEDEV